jgi:hypothetical protein
LSSILLFIILINNSSSILVILVLFVVVKYNPYICNKIKEMEDKILERLRKEFDFVGDEKRYQKLL